VAKSVARQLATAALWIRIQTSLKNQKMGDINSVPIPEDSKIYFWDIEGISDTVNKFVKKHPKEDKKILIVIYE
jgi:hypothetical protein